MAYPSIQQYQEALQHPGHAFTDQLLAKGKIAVSGLGVPRVLSGGFALTYAVETGGRKYAVRCFHREAKNLERRYEAIAKKLKSLSSPHFLEFEYQPKGVNIGNNAFPVVKMAWATGETLGVFIENHHRDASKVKNLIASLTQLSKFLEQAGIAHGDVQDLNLMVSNDGRSVQLIDYDGMFVPELASLGGSELGHRDYQHPQRDEKKYDASLDRFSFIALNLALRALCQKPSLWSSSQSGAGVIVFRANDYADPGSSAVLSEISKIPGLQQDAQNFAAICGNGFNAIPTLSQFISGANIPRSTIQVKTRPIETNASSTFYISAYPVLDATDYTAFERNIGQMVELVGRIVEVKVDRTRGGKPYVFINFGHWRGQTVKINLWSEALSKGGERPSERWIGRWVTIRGLIEPVYSNKKYQYDHISITADAIGQISQLTEVEAKYRLKSPKGVPGRAATNSNNAAVLDRLRGSTPNQAGSASAPVPPTSTPVSHNRGILNGMQTNTRPSVPPQSRSSHSSSQGITPPPRRTPSSTPPAAKPRGFWGWLADLLS